jgi:hypothetical protein
MSAQAQVVTTGGSCCLNCAVATADCGVVIVDPGATQSCCRDRARMGTTVPCSVDVTVGKAGTVVHATEQGRMTTGYFDVTAGETLYSPEFAANLFSTNRARKNGNLYLIHGDHSFLVANLFETPGLTATHCPRLNQLLIDASDEARARSHQYHREHLTEATTTGAALVGGAGANHGEDDDSHDTESDSDSTDEGDEPKDDLGKISNATLEHQRSGHVGITCHQRAIREKLVNGIRVTAGAVEVDCPQCIGFDSSRSSYAAQRKNPATRFGERVCCDAQSEMGYSVLGESLPLAMVDEHTGYSWLYTMKNRSTPERFKKVAEWKTSYDQLINNMPPGTFMTVPRLQLDPAAEHRSPAFKKKCYDELGVIVTVLPADTWKANGLVEVYWRKIKHMAQCQTALAGPTMATLWAYSMAHANYLRNRFPTGHRAMTPYEAVTGVMPDVKRLRTYGSIGLVRIHDVDREKKHRGLSRRVAIMVGYDENSGGWLMRDVETKRVRPQHHVKFFENMDTRAATLARALEMQTMYKGGLKRPVRNVAQEATVPAPTDRRTHRTPTPRIQHNASAFVQHVTLPTTARALDVGGAALIHLPSASDIDYPDIGQVEGGLSSVLVANGQYVESRAKEVAMLNQHGTWEVWEDEHGVEKPMPEECGGAVPAMWVDQRKRNGEEKSRLVYNGSKEEIFGNTWAGTPRMESFNLLLVLVAHLDLDLRHYDVSSAYLNSFIPEGVPPKMMRLPNTVGLEGKLVRLRKALYGMKEAGALWQQLTIKLLRKEGFKQLTNEHLMFYREIDGKPEVVMVHVDDFAHAPSKHFSDEQKQQLLGAMHDTGWNVKDLGDLEIYLGLEIERDRANRKITLGQPRYITTVLKTYGMENCAPVDSPSVTGNTLVVRGEDEEKVEPKYYRGMCGSLLYMKESHPEMSETVSKLCKFMADPGVTHLQAGKRALAYASKTKTDVRVFSAKDMKLEMFSDASHADCPETSRSTTGILAFVGGCLVSDRSARQQWKEGSGEAGVSLSSFGSETYAGSEAMCEGVWLRNFLEEVGFEQVEPTPLYIDNQAAIASAYNPGRHGSTRHLMKRMRFMRERVACEQFVIIYCTTKEQLADLWTKSLPVAVFRKILAQVRGECEWDLHVRLG